MVGREKLFWEVVEEIGWGKSYDFHILKDKMIQRYSRIVLMEIWQTYIELFEKLEIRIKNYNSSWGIKIPIGDTELGRDNINHIIGLGHEEYRRAFHNPKLVLERVESGDFVQSFSYVLPSWIDHINAPSNGCLGIGWKH